MLERKKQQDAEKAEQDSAAAANGRAGKR
jgi:hypothetical protein